MKKAIDPRIIKQSSDLETRWYIAQAKSREAERIYKAAEKRYRETKQQTQQAFANLCNFRSKHGLGRR